MGEQGEDAVAACGEDAVEVAMDIGDEVDGAHREAIRASVATLAERSAQASRRASRFSQSQAELSAALTRSLRDMMEARPEVTWVMRPGRIYTFNVDGWVYCKADSGFGVPPRSSASVRLLGQIIALTAFFD
jgi:hypothetical protein